MHKKDLLQRQFEEFGKVLAMILGYKKNLDWEKFKGEIERVSKQFASTDLEMTETCPESEFANNVLFNKDLTPDQKKIIGTLLFEKLQMYLELGLDTDQTRQLKERCMKIYTVLKNNHTSNEFDLDVHYKLEMLARIDL